VTAQLLRAFTVADGRWRLDPGTVDPLLITKMLVAYEDRRFYEPFAALISGRIAVLACRIRLALHGRIVSGGSTLTMQVARLLEDSGTGAAGKARSARCGSPSRLERHLTKDPRSLTSTCASRPMAAISKASAPQALAWLRQGTAPPDGRPRQRFLVAIPQSPETRRPDRFPLAARSRARQECWSVMTARGRGLY
jgi:penicillin-binding protein 1C